MFEVINKGTGEVKKVYATILDGEDTKFLTYDEKFQLWYWEYSVDYKPYEKGEK